MGTNSMIFRDREDAARQLAELFRGRQLHDPLVLAIPRGGVATGAVLARELGAELDVVLARKIRAPYQPEFALGAIGEDGRITLNPGSWDVPGVTEEYLEAERQHQLSEIERRKKLIRAVRPPARLEGRSVIVADDGIATGSTMIAAAPVASPDRLAEVGKWCDETVCLLTPEDFLAIGQFYDDFSPVEDDEVIRILREMLTPGQPGT